MDNIGIYFDFNAQKLRTVELIRGQSAVIALSTQSTSSYPSEMDEFVDGLSSFIKEEFRCFRREHPDLTDQEAMSLFKISRGRRHVRGI